MLIVSLLIFIAYYFIAIKKKQSYFYTVPIILIFTFLFAGYIVADSLTGDGINEAVKFQLMTSWTGTGYGEFIPQLAGALIYIVSTAFIVSVSIKVSKLNHVPLATLLGIFAISSNPGAHDLYEWVRPFTHFDEIESIPISKLKNEGQPKLSSAQKSFIYIYAESFERTFFNDDVFPGLITHLKDDKNNYIDFTNVEEVYATGATMMGMVASQCGVIAVPTVTGDLMSGIECLGNKLSKVDYDLHYIQGGALDFASTRNFYNNHGFTNLTGLDFFKKKYKDQKYFSQWGVYDEYMFEEGLKRYKSLKSKEKPFGLVVVTLDTHYPKGHQSPLCNLKYKDGKNPYLNAIKCSDYNISRFIERVLREDNGETIIILASDHLALKTTANHLLTDLPRRNLLRFYNVNKSKDNYLKPASTLDIGTTIMNLVGIQGQLGLGVNLFSKQRTILERYERKTDDFLRSLTPKIKQASGMLK